jgi:putative transposase
VLRAPIANRLKEIINQVVNETHSELIEMEVVEDHIHLLLECNPQYGIHRVVKRIKGLSSRLLRQEFKELTTRLPTLWSNSYFVSTVGGASLEIIKQYIENQKYV